MFTKQNSRSDARMGVLAALLDGRERKQMAFGRALGGTQARFCVQCVSAHGRAWLPMRPPQVSRRDIRQ
jgi:hypothetical protein